MAAFRIDGAAAPGTSTPTRNDNAPVQRGVIGGHGEQDNPDSAKTTATTVARAALLGIEARQIGADAWLLRHARGAEIGIVRGLPALVAAVAGVEAAHDDVRELVQRMRRPA